MPSEIEREIARLDRLDRRFWIAYTIASALALAFFSAGLMISLALAVASDQSLSQFVWTLVAAVAAYYAVLTLRDWLKARFERAGDAV